MEYDYPWNVRELENTTGYHSTAITEIYAEKDQWKAA